MAKKYQIDLVIGTAHLDAAVEKNRKGTKQIEDDAAKAAKAREAADKVAARSAQRLTDLTQQTAVRSAARQKEIAQKLAADLERIAAGKEAKEQASATRVAEAQQIIAMRAVDRANQKAQREADAEARRSARVRRIWTDDEIAAKVSNQRIANANAKRLEAAMKAADVEYKGNRNGWEGADKLKEAVMAVGAAYASLGVVAAGMSAIGDSVREAAQHQKQMADEFIRYRDAQREYQSMKGGATTIKGTLKDAEFGVPAGMVTDEAKAFRDAMMASGQQHRGTKVTEEQYAEFEKRAAAYATAQGIDPKVMGDLAGKVIGFRDYRKEGADAPFKDLTQAFKILQSGAGENNTNAEQLGMLASFALSPDEAMGAFQSWKDVAIAQSVAAEVNPREAEVYVRAAQKAFHPKDDEKSKSLMDQAGITPRMGLEESSRRLAPIVLKEAQDKKSTVGQVLQAYGLDEREQKAVGAFINKGVAGGAFDARNKTAKENDDVAAAVKQLEAEKLNPEGAFRDREAKARLERSRLRAGSRTATAETILKDVDSELTDQDRATVGKWGSFYDNVLGKANMMLGGHSYQENVRTEQAEAILRRRAKEQGVKLPDDFSLKDPWIGGSDKARNEGINRAILAFQAQGGNATADLTREQVDATRREHLEVAKEQLKIMREARDRKAPAAPAAANAVPVVMAPVGQGR